MIARRAEWLPLLWERARGRCVLKAWRRGTSSRAKSSASRCPGIRAINFVLHEALDGGGPSSRRLDPLGKGMAQILLDMPIDVPRSVAREAREEV